MARDIVAPQYVESSPTGNKPVFPALQGRFPATGPPEKSENYVLFGRLTEYLNLGNISERLFQRQKGRARTCRSFC